MEWIFQAHLENCGSLDLSLSINNTITVVGSISQAANAWLITHAAVPVSAKVFGIVLHHLLLHKSGRWKINGQILGFACGSRAGRPCSAVVGPPIHASSLSSPYATPSSVSVQTPFRKCIDNPQKAIPTHIAMCSDGESLSITYLRTSLVGYEYSLNPAYRLRHTLKKTSTVPWPSTTSVFLWFPSATQSVQQEPTGTALLWFHQRSSDGPTWKNL